MEIKTEDVKTLIKNTAILEYLKGVFFDVHPDGVPELGKLADLMENREPENLNEILEEVVKQSVAELTALVNKYDQ